MSEQSFRQDQISMLNVDKASALQDIIQRWKADGLKVGFVPTMGGLHEGHLSLARLALEKTDRCVVSIYVNPAQFAPHEDFDAYPRDMDVDLRQLQALGVHLAYLPTTEELYPNGVEITVRAGKAGEGLDTDFRPHFFHGVATVVHRLFEIVQPDLAVFGEKDYQQLMVIQEMVEEKNLPIEIIGGPTARDEEGLALSSRNQYLTPEQLPIARQLNKILREISNPEDAKAALLEAGFDKVDYVEERWGRRLGAGWVGKTRLLDNIAL